MEKYFFVLAMNDVRCRAHQLTQRNNIQNPFSKDNWKAGKKWLKCFQQQHPQLSA
jgi:hypothetical protein